MPVKHCKQCGGRLTLEGVCNNPRCHRARRNSPLNVKSLPTLAGSLGAPDGPGAATPDATISTAMTRFAMLEVKAPAPTTPEKPVRRKAPPDIKRGTPEWDSFEREYCTTATPASEDKAHAMAAVLHSGQTDQVGMDYLAHPKRVLGHMLTTERYQSLSPEDQAAARQAAWLHDALEDTPASPDDLKAAGFSEKVIAAIDGVSKRDGEATDAYFERVRSNPISWALKIGDHLDNTDEDRRQNLLGSPKHPVAPEDLNPDGTMKKDGKIPPFDRLGIKYVAASRSLQIEIPANLRRYA